MIPVFFKIALKMKVANELSMTGTSTDDIHNGKKQLYSIILYKLNWIKMHPLSVITVIKIFIISSIKLDFKLLRTLYLLFRSWASQ